MARLLPLLLLWLAACGPTPRCDWHLCAPEGSAYIWAEGAEGLPYSDVVEQALADWRAAGLPDPRIRRVSADFRARLSGGVRGYVATSTRRRIGLVVSAELGEVYTRRIIRHELVHAFGARAGLPEGLDRDHSDRQRCPVDDDWCAR